jgi:hypothetical protein
MRFAVLVHVGANNVPGCMHGAARGHGWNMFWLSIFRE